MCWRTTLRRMTTGDSGVVRELANKLVLGALLDEVARRFGGYKILNHWQQGEFHHDLVLEVEREEGLKARLLVVATNCNGGVKEVLSVDAMPERGGLWRHRCPANGDFNGAAPSILAQARTTHWFDPCELLAADARSELRVEFRERQRGGGWVPRPSSV